MTKDGYRSGEHDWPAPAHESGEQWIVTKRKEYLLYLMRTIGYAQITRKEVCRTMGISLRQIERDFKAIYKEGINKDMVSQAQMELFTTTELAMKALQRSIIEAKTGKERVSAATAAISAVKEKTDFLERFAIKEASGTPTTPGKIIIEWTGITDKKGETKEPDTQ
jgi:hypothetical protein